jgi:hypothetical protein
MASRSKANSPVHRATFLGLKAVVARANGREFARNRVVRVGNLPGFHASMQVREEICQHEGGDTAANNPY